MPRLPRLQYEDAIYHVVTRGDGQRRLFHDEGHYKAYPVEDEGYYWNLSRYVHLNPCNGAKPLADSPERYLHSSYAGYARKTRRVDWVDYDQHHRNWAARNGGDPESVNRQFVKAGMHGPADPALDRLKDWVYGGEEFLRRMVQLASSDDEWTEVRQSIRKSQLSVETVIAATAKEYDVEPDDYTGFRSGAPGRDVAAYLCRRYTTATLGEVSSIFGLSHRDSSGDLVKRARRAREENPRIERRIRKIEKRLCLNPESLV